MTAAIARAAVAVGADAPGMMHLSSGLTLLRANKDLGIQLRRERIDAANLIDRFAATEEDHARAAYWADFALRRFGADAPLRLRESLLRDGGSESKRALGMAIKRAEANLGHRIAILTI